jgi:hypothetical protein
MRQIRNSIEITENFSLHTEINYSQPTWLISAVAALIFKGFAVIKVPGNIQASMWSLLDGIDSVPLEEKTEFTFPDVTDGFFDKGGEHAKYTDNIDLCDRFCYWHKNRASHKDFLFTKNELYSNVLACEELLSSLAQDLVSGLSNFFHGDEKIDIRDSSYIQICMYENNYQEASRKYLQDRHEDGHLITLIKPTRDGLVIYINGVETPIFLADDEVIIITGSLLTALSDGRIPPMYHAVKNPLMRLSRKSLVYFVIPDLLREYSSLIKKNKISLAALADESHKAFGNSSLISPEPNHR